jgi:hypothetical protein
MARALITLSFVAVLLLWLQFEFRKKVSFTKHIGWLVAAIVIQMISSIISLVIDDRIVGNFFYHAVGGGVTSAFLFFYLLKTYNVQLNWRIQIVTLYAFVCALGVMNEIAEYVGEFATRVGMFSWDSHDTWRDLVANTTGALVGWIICRLVLLIARQRSTE